MPRPDDDAAVFVISVAAELAGMHAQTLRQYDRLGLVTPGRSGGGGRRYYRPQDVELIKGIRHMLYDQGYTIKGVQKLLRENGNQFLIAIGSGDRAAAEAIAQRKQADIVPLTAAALPPQAVVSVGEDNDYGHPTSAHLTMLARNGYAVHRTDRDGHVAVVEDGRGRLRVVTSR